MIIFVKIIVIMAPYVRLCLSIVSALFLCDRTLAVEDDLSKAIEMYRNGLYSSALDILQSMPQSGDDPVVDGYAVLCAQKMHADGYERSVDRYIDEYPSGIIKNEIIREYAYDLFDRKEFSQALKLFIKYPYNEVPIKEKAMFTFERGYCLYRDGQAGEAMSDFSAVSKMEIGDYMAPACYCAGYILYNKGDFKGAIEWFNKSAVDERLSHISNYYSVICHYQMKEYGQVLKLGLPLFGSKEVDPQRKHFLARMISESYLVAGDKQKAWEYYSQSGEEGLRSRADYFYAGSLMFATEDYKSAIENYGHVTQTPDSLAQIAWYNTALANIRAKNKVGALDAFMNAASLDFDKKMKEDAFFNWAKLAFDINRDTSVFAKYLKLYSDKVRGELIYSYMALASLSDHDWQAAIDNFDKLDELSPKDINNYVHANYLRGCQLFDSGSYRSSMSYFQTVGYYSPKDDRLGQLSRFNYAMASYRNEQWSAAAQEFVSLYNSSALFGMNENTNLAYYAAYSYLKQGDYSTAQKWFKTYSSQAEAPYRKEAMTRLADCCFADGRYKDAVDAYIEAVDKFYDVNDIYPYYRLAIAKGLANDKKGKLASLVRVLDASPSAPYYSEALFELSRAYQENNQVDQAAKTCRKLIAESPDTLYKARGLLELGTLKRNAGFPDAAVECYRTVIEQMPSSGLVEDALHAMESLYTSQKTPAKYLAYLESIGRGSQVSEQDRQKMLFNAAQQLFYASDNAGAIASFTEFKKTFPDSPENAKADYFIGRSYENTGDKLKAMDAYLASFGNATSLSGDYLADAVKRFAAINFAIDNFSQSSAAYKRLLSSDAKAEDKFDARVGLMRSLFKSKEYQATLSQCDSVLFSAGSKVSPTLLREVKITKSQSLVSLSRRDEAIPVLEELSRYPGTLEGDQACLMLIQHSFDKADYDDVIARVHDFALNGAANEYCLARAFIVLGDAYREKGNVKQAKATYESIIEGYSVKSDGVISDVKDRLEKMGGDTL